MKPAKDSTAVIEFMALFQKLRDWIDDDPNGLEQLAADDEAVKGFCKALGVAATLLSMNEKRQRRLFTATDEDHTYVDFVRDGIRANGAARMGEACWRRLTEERAGGAKSVFNFDVLGSVAKSTHAGIPWLRFIREQIGARVHFWPFDGWDIPAGRSAIAEVYPALWSRSFANQDRTGDQHDAFSIAAWLSRAARDSSLAAFLNPDLSPPERALAQAEGWILGVPGLIRAGKKCDDSVKSTACDSSMFRLH